MGSVWLTIPSARPPEEANPIFTLWRERGYRIAVLRDDGAASVDADVEFKGEYRGYANAVNFLVGWLIANQPDAEWFIAAGDDTEPDQAHSAYEIALDCGRHFGSVRLIEDSISVAWDTAHGTFGVMQPTGDRWHEGVGGFTNAPIDRVAGSAWYGREYCRRMYGGKGPLYAGYQHMFVDEEAQEVALKMGVFWQRRDLVQKHRHWGRGATDGAVVANPVVPPHLVQWNTREHWLLAKTLFEQRRATDFPGHEPIP